MWCASSPMPKAACGWCGRWPWNPRELAGRHPLSQHGSPDRTQKAGAAARGMMQRVPTCPSVAPCAPPSRPLRAASGGGVRPVLTAAARGATLNAGRDEETAPSVEQRNCTRYLIILQNFSDTTTEFLTTDILRVLFVNCDRQVTTFFKQAKAPMVGYVSTKRTRVRGAAMVLPQLRRA